MFGPYSAFSLYFQLWSESILSEGSAMVYIDTEQRQTQCILHFYTTLFQTSTRCSPGRRISGLEIKQGLFVYTRFGLTFRSVSVLAPIFRKYPLGCWWIFLVADPSLLFGWIVETQAQIFPPGDQDLTQPHLLCVGQDTMVLVAPAQCSSFINCVV